MLVVVLSFARRKQVVGMWITRCYVLDDLLKRHRIALHQQIAVDIEQSRSYSLYPYSTL